MYDEVSHPARAILLMALKPGVVHGFKLHANHTADYYEPENIWLSK
jgi:hypothetical protein